MQAILVQPPFTQLNSPYPAVHYLEAFLKSRGMTARSWDHSILLYREIFSRKGLEKVFDAVEKTEGARAAAHGDGDGRAAGELARYLSYRELYLECIDGLVGFLSGKDPAFAHRLAAAAELPRGARASRLIEEAEGRVRSEDAPALATAMLEDLSDLIRYCLDPDFGTVRYGDRLARSRGDFGEVEASLDSAWMLGAFYEPWLEAFWKEREAELDGAASAAAEGPELLVLVSVPFPGCLAGALACARSCREAFGRRAAIVLGGGYVSTELRSLSDPRIFKYCDYLSFDAGYGSLASIIDELEGAPDTGGLYKTMKPGALGGILACGVAGAGAAAPPAGQAEHYAGIEAAALAEVFPDYASADYGLYLGAVDSGNAMHRLWSDSPWLKYSLAHGCYWHRCSFCDTELDYVRNFRPSRVEAVMAAADAASRRQGIYGIHFVDEAMPMAGLLEFARQNRARSRRGERPFHFWGNVRFDSSWTAGRCEYLAASGLEAVSGGIEIATEAGLAMTNKGFDLSALVRSIVAMRRSGLLVHAYLIYGFPGQAAADIADSAEIMRQCFASGLVDSAFWHRFVLTRGSRMMAEFRAGRRPDLVPLDRGGSFAANDLEFEGETSFDRFDAPLAAALEAWMSGEELEKPVQEWFAEAGMRKLKASVGPGLVEGLIAAAEAGLDAELARPPEAQSRAAWVAGRPRAAEGGLAWAYRGELVTIRIDHAAATRLGGALDGLAAAADPPAARDFLASSGLEGRPETLASLREAGLVFI
jgi:hypothetical protein